MTDATCDHEWVRMPTLTTHPMVHSRYCEKCGRKETRIGDQQRWHGDAPEAKTEAASDE